MRSVSVMDHYEVGSRTLNSDDYGFIEAVISGARATSLSHTFTEAIIGFPFHATCAECVCGDHIDFVLVYE